MKATLRVLLLLIIVLPPLSVHALDFSQAEAQLVAEGWTPQLAEKIISRVRTMQGRKVAVFDHDNTLICGDITEGNGKSQPGMMRSLLRTHQARGTLNLTIPLPFGNDGWAYYHHWAKHHPREAYAWICTLLSGMTPVEASARAARYYREHLKNAIFPEMQALVRVLQGLDVEVYIVSASAHDIVKAAAGYFHLPTRNIHGIRLACRDGRLSKTWLNPISFAAGKTWYIQHFVGDFPRGNILVFGDSYRTDGHMLRFAARQGGFALLVNPDASIAPTLKRDGIYGFALPSLPSLDR